MVYHKRVYTPNNHSEPTRPLRYDYLVLSTMCPSLIYESMEDLFRAVNKIVVSVAKAFSRNIANFCYPGAAKPILCRNYLQQITAVKDAQILGESQCITTYTQHIYNGKGQTAARRHTLSVCLADHLTAVRIAPDAKIRRFVGVFCFLFNALIYRLYFFFSYQGNVNLHPKNTSIKNHCLYLHNVVRIIL